MKKKICSLASTYKAIDESRSILSKLEEMANNLSMSESVNLVDVIEKTTVLRELHQRIVVGFVESCTLNGGGVGQKSKT